MNSLVMINVFHSDYAKKPSRKSKVICVDCKALIYKQLPYGNLFLHV